MSYGLNQRVNNPVYIGLPDSLAKRREGTHQRLQLVTVMRMFHGLNQRVSRPAYIGLSDSLAKRREGARQRR